MARSVSIAELPSALQEIVGEFGRELTAQMKADVQIAGEVCARTTQDMAGSVLGGTGEYAGGWTHDSEEEAHAFYDVTHNTSQPSLTHLLEKGHMKRGRGGWVAGRRHIADGYEAGVEELERRMR